MAHVEKDTLLIVDDEPTNLKVLLTYLHDLNYEVLVAQDGEDALTKVDYVQPDLILLDVMMPKLDGFETCRRLKANKNTRDIPVIFMTALTETVDKVKAFEIGAVDYITKPIQHEEVSARIIAHLSLRKLQKILKQQNEAIENKNRELQQQNMELSAFAHVVIRDLKKPLVRQAGFTNILMKELSQRANNHSTIKFLQEIEQSRYKMANVVDDLLLLANVRTQEVVMEAPDMVTIIAQVRHRLSGLIEKHQGKITAPPSWPVVWGYTPWIEKVWEIYISNGLEYGGRPPRLELGASTDKSNHIRFWVQDNGPGLSSEQQKHLFVPFSHIGQARIIEEGYGLKLSIVRLVVEKCGGWVGVESQIGRGSCFYFTLPAIG